MEPLYKIYSNVIGENSHDLAVSRRREKERERRNGGTGRKERILTLLTTEDIGRIGDSPTQGAAVPGLATPP